MRLRDEQLPRQSGVLLPKAFALGEPAELLGMARGEIGIDEHGGQESLAKALVAPRPVEEHHDLPEAPIA